MTLGYPVLQRAGTHSFVALITLIILSSFDGVCVYTTMFLVVHSGLARNTNHIQQEQNIDELS